MYKYIVIQGFSSSWRWIENVASYVDYIQFWIGKTLFYGSMCMATEWLYVRFSLNNIQESEGTQEVFVCIGKSAVKYHTLLRQVCKQLEHYLDWMSA